MRSGVAFFRLVAILFLVSGVIGMAMAPVMIPGYAAFHIGLVGPRAPDASAGLDAEPAADPDVEAEPEAERPE